MQLTVVIAGGDTTIRQWLLTTLRGAGHNSTHVPTGREALAKLEEHTYDLLVVCVGLEDLPAAEVAAQAQQRQRGLAMLFVADPHAQGVPWEDVPAGGVLLYGPSGPDLLPAVAVALTRARR